MDQTNITSEDRRDHDKFRGMNLKLSLPVAIFNNDEKSDDDDNKTPEYPLPEDHPFAILNKDRHQKFNFANLPRSSSTSTPLFPDLRKQRSTEPDMRHQSEKSTNHCKKNKSMSTKGCQSLVWNNRAHLIPCEQSSSAGANVNQTQQCLSCNTLRKHAATQCEHLSKRNLFQGLDLDTTSIIRTVMKSRVDRRCACQHNFHSSAVNTRKISKCVSSSHTNHLCQAFNKLGVSTRVGKITSSFISDKNNNAQRGNFPTSAHDTQDHQICKMRPTVNTLNNKDAKCLTSPKLSEVLDRSEDDDNDIKSPPCLLRMDDNEHPVNTMLRSPPDLNHPPILSPVSSATKLEVPTVQQKDSNSNSSSNVDSCPIISDASYPCSGSDYSLSAYRELRASEFSREELKESGNAYSTPIKSNNIVEQMEDKGDKVVSSETVMNEINGLDKDEKQEECDGATDSSTTITSDLSFGKEEFNGQQNRNDERGECARIENNVSTSVTNSQKSGHILSHSLPSPKQNISGHQSAISDSPRESIVPISVKDAPNSPYRFMTSEKRPTINEDNHLTISSERNEVTSSETNVEVKEKAKCENTKNEDCYVAYSIVPSSVGDAPNSSHCFQTSENRPEMNIENSLTAHMKINDATLKLSVSNVEKKDIHQNSEEEECLPIENVVPRSQIDAPKIFSCLPISESRSEMNVGDRMVLSNKTNNTTSEASTLEVTKETFCEIVEKGDFILAENIVPKSVTSAPKSSHGLRASENRSAMNIDNRMAKLPETNGVPPDIFEAEEKAERQAIKSSDADMAVCEALRESEIENNTASCPSNTLENTPHPLQCKNSEEPSGNITPQIMELSGPSLPKRTSRKESIEETCPKSNVNNLSPLLPGSNDIDVKLDSTIITQNRSPVTKDGHSPTIDDGMTDNEGSEPCEDDTFSLKSIGSKQIHFGTDNTSSDSKSLDEELTCHSPSTDNIILTIAMPRDVAMPHDLEMPRDVAIPLTKDTTINVDGSSEIAHIISSCVKLSGSSIKERFEYGTGTTYTSQGAAFLPHGFSTTFSSRCQTTKSIRDNSQSLTPLPTKLTLVGRPIATRCYPYSHRKPRLGDSKKRKTTKKPSVKIFGSRCKLNGKSHGYLSFVNSLRTPIVSSKLGPNNLQTKPPTPQNRRCVPSKINDGSRCQTNSSPSKSIESTLPSTASRSDFAIASTLSSSKENSSAQSVPPTVNNVSSSLLCITSTSTHTVAESSLYPMENVIDLTETESNECQSIGLIENESCCSTSSSGQYQAAEESTTTNVCITAGEQASLSNLDKTSSASSAHDSQTSGGYLSCDQKNVETQQSPTVDDTDKSHSVLDSNNIQENNVSYFNRTVSPTPSEDEELLSFMSTYNRPKENNIYLNPTTERSTTPTQMAFVRKKELFTIEELANQENDSISDSVSERLLVVPKCESPDFLHERNKLISVEEENNRMEVAVAKVKTNSELPLKDFFITNPDKQSYSSLDKLISVEEENNRMEVAVAKVKTTSELPLKDFFTTNPDKQSYSSLAQAVIQSKNHCTSLKYPGNDDDDVLKFLSKEDLKIESLSSSVPENITFLTGTSSGDLIDLTSECSEDEILLISSDGEETESADEDKITMPSNVVERDIKQAKSDTSEDSNAFPTIDINVDEKQNLETSVTSKIKSYPLTCEVSKTTQKPFSTKGKGFKNNSSSRACKLSSKDTVKSLADHIKKQALKMSWSKKAEVSARIHSIIVEKSDLLPEPLRTQTILPAYCKVDVKNVHPHVSNSSGSIETEHIQQMTSLLHKQNANPEYENKHTESECVSLLTILPTKQNYNTGLDKENSESEHVGQMDVVPMKQKDNSVCENRNIERENFSQMAFVPPQKKDDSKYENRNIESEHVSQMAIVPPHQKGDSKYENGNSENENVGQMTFVPLQQKDDSQNENRNSESENLGQMAFVPPKQNVYLKSPRIEPINRSLEVGSLVSTANQVLPKTVNHQETPLQSLRQFVSESNKIEIRRTMAAPIPSMPASLNGREYPREPVSRPSNPYTSTNENNSALNLSKKRPPESYQTVWCSKFVGDESLTPCDKSIKYVQDTHRNEGVALDSNKYSKPRPGIFDPLLHKLELLHAAKVINPVHLKTPNNTEPVSNHANNRPITALVSAPHNPSAKSPHFTFSEEMISSEPVDLSRNQKNQTKLFDQTAQRETTCDGPLNLKTMSSETKCIHSVQSNSRADNQQTVNSLHARTRQLDEQGIRSVHPAIGALHHDRPPPTNEAMDKIMLERQSISRLAIPEQSPNHQQTFINPISSKSVQAEPDMRLCTTNAEYTTPHRQSVRMHPSQRHDFPFENRQCPSPVVGKSSDNGYRMYMHHGQNVTHPNVDRVRDCNLINCLQNERSRSEHSFVSYSNTVPSSADAIPPHLQQIPPVQYRHPLNLAPSNTNQHQHQPRDQENIPGNQLMPGYPTNGKRETPLSHLIRPGMNFQASNILSYNQSNVSHLPYSKDKSNAVFSSHTNNNLSPHGATNPANVPQPVAFRDNPVPHNHLISNDTISVRNTAIPHHHPLPSETIPMRHNTMPPQPPISNCAPATRNIPIQYHRPNSNDAVPSYNPASRDIPKNVSNQHSHSTSHMEQSFHSIQRPVFYMGQNNMQPHTGFNPMRYQVPPILNLMRPPGDHHNMPEKRNLKPLFIHNNPTTYPFPQNPDYIFKDGITYKKATVFTCSNRQPMPSSDLLEHYIGLSHPRKSKNHPEENDKSSSHRKRRSRTKQSASGLRKKPRTDSDRSSIESDKLVIQETSTTDDPLPVSNTTTVTRPNGTTPYVQGKTVSAPNALMETMGLDDPAKRIGPITSSTTRRPSIIKEGITPECDRGMKGSESSNNTTGTKTSIKTMDGPILCQDSPNPQSQITSNANSKKISFDSGVLPCGVESRSDSGFSDTASSLDQLPAVGMDMGYVVEEYEESGIKFVSFKPLDDDENVGDSSCNGNTKVIGKDIRSVERPGVETVLNAGDNALQVQEDHSIPPGLSSLILASQKIEAVHDRSKHKLSSNKKHNDADSLHHTNRYENGPKSLSTPNTDRDPSKNFCTREPPKADIDAIKSGSHKEFDQLYKKKSKADAYRHRVTEEEKQVADLLVMLQTPV